MDMSMSQAARYLGVTGKTPYNALERGDLVAATPTVLGGQQAVTAESVVRLRQKWEAEGRKLLPIPQDLEEALR